MKSFEDGQPMGSGAHCIQLWPLPRSTCAY